MKFLKMHGLGNDFIVVDCIGGPRHEELDEAALPQLAQRLCDRHFGVGADGILLALRGEQADFRMRLINGDGSEAEHCGNGIRCIARYVFDAGHTQATHFSIETVGRVNQMQLAVTDGEVTGVTVDMLAPVFTRERIPMVGAPGTEAIEEVLEVDGHSLAFTAVSMGNPHAVTFVEDAVSFPVTTLGPLVENHPVFPRRTNTEFIQVIGPEELRMRVWERGAGETLACGTGACASVVAAARTGRASRRAVVHLPGGDLLIDWRDDNHVYMTGPATPVFAGEVD